MGFKVGVLENIVNSRLGPVAPVRMGHLAAAGALRGGLSKPVARFEEALATIQTLWRSKGELVNRDSEWFPLRNAVFDLPPYKGRWPEIWIAAHGPRMLRLAGRHADAWYPAFIFAPKDYAQRLETVRSAASDAGRDPTSVTPAIMLTTMPGRTSDDVDEALESHGARMYGLTSSAEVVAAGGRTRWAPISRAPKTLHPNFSTNEPRLPTSRRFPDHCQGDVRRRHIERDH